MPVGEMHKLQQQPFESQKLAMQLQDKLVAKTSEEGAEEEGAEERQTRAAKAKKERESPHGGRGACSEDKDKAK